MWCRTDRSHPRPPIAGEHASSPSTSTSGPGSCAPPTPFATDSATSTCRSPDDVDDAQRFDLIWSNPPIRIGKDPLHQLLTTWLRRLAPAGAAVLVVQKHLGADSLQRWLIDSGWPTERLASSKGYRLLQVPP